MRLFGKLSVNFRSAFYVTALDPADGRGNLTSLFIERERQGIDSDPTIEKIEGEIAFPYKPFWLINDQHEAIPDEVEFCEHKTLAGATAERRPNPIDCMAMDPQSLKPRKHIPRSALIRPH